MTFLSFSPGKSSTTFTAHHILWGTNFKHEDVLGFNRTNCKKIHCQTRFSCSCISKISRKLSKYRKTLTFYFFRARADYLSFRPQRACDSTTIGSHLKYSSSYGLMVNFKSVAKSSATLLTFPLHKLHTYLTTLDECGPGSYSSTGIAKCFTCPSGTYSSEQRNKECISCPEGTVTVISAATGIEDCGSKYIRYSMKGSD